MYILLLSFSGYCFPAAASSLSLWLFYHLCWVVFSHSAWCGEISLGVRFVKKANELLGIFSRLTSGLKLETVPGYIRFVFSGKFLSKELGGICSCSHSVVLCLQGTNQKVQVFTVFGVLLDWMLCVKIKTSQCITQNYCPQEGSLCLRIKSIAIYSRVEFPHPTSVL